jgi:hypothetical protein
MFKSILSIGNLVVTIRTTCCNVEELCTLFTHCIYMFAWSSVTDYFRKHHQKDVLCNVCSEYVFCAVEIQLFASRLVVVRKISINCTG